MEKLNKARETINQVDKEIAVLFEKRMEAVREIAEYKKERGLPVFDSTREAEIIEKAKGHIKNEEISELYVSYVRDTMNISKVYQYRIMQGADVACDTSYPDFKADSEVIIPISLENDSYDIILERGALKRAGELISAKSKVLIVTDSGVPREYAEMVASQFAESYIFTFGQGEQSKSFDTYMSICEELLRLSFTRKDAIIAVGGGVVGDISGFAAATYMRGIDFYNIPTTLLSQVDSSIGGKTAVDLNGIKNIIGAFYRPKKVIIDPEVLVSLPERHIKNGLAESVKMGLCFDEGLFDIFRADNYYERLEEIIVRSLYIKKRVVEQDEKEAGLRKSLNFGHTIGHGIEASLEGELYHGECVALGMLPMCDEEVKQRLEAVLLNTGLPVTYPYDKERVREIISHDKKSGGNKISVVKCDEIGSFYFEELTIDEIMNLI